ncbi:hypothetical protein A9Q85_09085 [Cycloclasticus sp. 44_32_T64]|nr:hypothetical protein A9Q85_09085 [Cycloclasticus sp. 44_32_T64]
MAQLRPSVLYVLLTIAGILTGVGLIYGLFYDTERFEGNRYENSYVEFNDSLLTATQQQAIAFLKSENVEWAHFRFIEAIKNDDVRQVQAFIDLGMPLNSDSILLEIALSESTHKKSMLGLLDERYQLNLNGLFTLPNIVSEFDPQLADISRPYIQQKKEAFRQATNEYDIKLVSWEQALANKKQAMLKGCDNDACRRGRLNDVRRLFASSKPSKPQEDYIVKERVKVSLFSVFAWQKDQALMRFMREQGAEVIPNKLFLTDGTLIYFKVDALGNNVIIERGQ